MLNRFVKLPSVQSEFNSVQRELDIEIPQHLNVIDLSSSYLQIQCRVENSDTSNIGNPNINWSEGSNIGFHFDNCALIRRNQLNSDKQGLLESMPRADIINNTKKYYLDSVEDVESKRYLHINQVVSDVAYNRDSIFVNKVKLGSEKSSYNLNTKVDIPLRDICGLGSVDQLDLKKTGSIKLNMELNLNKIQVQDAPSLVLGSEGLCDNVTGSDQNVRTISTKNPFPDLQFSNYYVGMGINVTATGTGGASNVDVDTSIEEITWNSDKTITIKTTSDIYTNLQTGESLEDVEVAGFNSPTSNYSDLIIENIDLVVKQLNKDKADYDVIEYPVYSIEEGNGNGNTTFQRLFEVEPEISSFFLINQNQSTNNFLPQSCNSFQVFVNNVPMTNRLVNNKSPLYYLVLQKTWEDQGERMRNFLENALDSEAENLEDKTTNTDYDIGMAACSHCPISQKMKLIQVNVNDTAGINNFVLYKFKTRVLEL